MENDKSRKKKDGRFISVPTGATSCFENEEAFTFHFVLQNTKNKKTDEIISARNRAVTKMRF